MSLPGDTTTLAAPASVPTEPVVFVIDDDRSVLHALKRLLRSSGLTVEIYSSPALFLADGRTDAPACIVLDLRMPGLSGLDVQAALAARGRNMPIVFLSGNADVPSTARAMRAGAVDFLVKPIEAVELLDAVSRALARDTDALVIRAERDGANARLARLTRREREVCDGVLRGLLNKQIASELGTSEKTVKTHRGRAMHKLEVSSVPALVRLLALARQPARTP